MKNIRITTLCALLMACILNGCTAEADEQPEAVPQEVKVALRLSTLVMEEDAATRAEQPLSPDYENPIADLWILQFDREGIRVTCEEKKLSAPSLSSDIDDITLKTGICTVCVVANLGNDIPGGAWPDNLTAFKRLTVDMGWLANRETAAQTDDKQVCMFGYYEGNIQSEQQLINIVLGRLVCRLNIALSAETANVFSNVKIQLQKAQTSTYLFPTNLYLAPTDYSDTSLSPYPEETLTSGTLGTTPIYRYYNMAENVMSGIDPAPQHTQLKITATKSGTQYVKTIDLGRSDINDYSLLRNNNYTFNIVLK